MDIDRQKIFLAILKYISYVINFVIVACVLAFVGWYIMGLIQSGQENVHYSH